MAPRILARVASQPLSDYCMKLHQSQDVTIHINAALSEIVTTTEGHCSAVRLSDGTELPADMVIAGIGVQPDIQLASSSGLDCGNGIHVSSGYQTNDPHIWAIGDVAFAPEINPIRIESIHHAQYSGAVAAAAITSTQMPQIEAWWFWSDQYDVKFQMAGILPSAKDEAPTHIVRPGKKPESQSVWTWHQNRLVCIEAANDPQAYMIGKKCLEMGINPETIQIANPDFVLKTVLD